MNPDLLVFEPIDLQAHAELCIRFRADSFFASFGKAEGFHGKDAQSPTTLYPGGESVAEYLEWLTKRMSDFPGSCVHVWRAGEIIGQIEMGRFRLDHSIGYVNLLYLIPEFRGKGLGGQLDRFAVDSLRRAGHRAARLCVSPTNLPAVAFYRKHQWQDLGPREDRPEVHYMEKRWEQEEPLHPCGRSPSLAMRIVLGEEVGEDLHRAESVGNEKSSLMSSFQLH